MINDKDVSLSMENAFENNDPIFYVGKKFRNSKGDWLVLSMENKPDHEWLREYTLQNLHTREVRREIAELVADDVACGTFELLED